MFSQDGTTVGKSAWASKSSAELADEILAAMDETPHEVARIETSGSISACCLTADGQHVVFSTPGSVVRESIAGERKKLGDNSVTGRLVRVCDDNSIVILAGHQGVQLMDFQTGKGTHVVKPLKQGGRYIAHGVSANGNFVAVTDDAGNVQIIDIKNRKTHQFRSKEDLKLSSRAIGVSNDGKHLYRVDETMKLQMFDVNDVGTLSGSTFSNGEIFESREKMSVGDRTIGAVKISAASYVRRPPTGEMQGISGQCADLPSNCQVVNRDGRELLMIAMRTDDLRVKISGLTYEMEPTFTPMWILPEAKLNHISWDRTGQRLSCVNLRGEILVYDVAPYHYDWGASTITAIAKHLIEERRFSDLDDIAIRLVEDQDSVPRPLDHWFEWLSGYVFSELDDPDADEPHEFFAEWLKSSPESASAKYFSAAWHMQKAWRLRGDSYAFKLTEEQVRGFEKHVGIAKQLLGDPVSYGALPHSIALAIELAKASGASNDEKMILLKTLRNKFPAHELGHYRAVEMLMRRWGGEPGQMEDYMTRASDFVGGDRGDRLYGQLVLHLTLYFPMDQFFDSVQVDKDRMIRGILQSYPGRNINSEGYANILLWHAIEKQSLNGYKLLDHYREHAAFFGGVLNRTGQPNALKKHFMSSREVRDYNRQVKEARRKD